MQTSSIGELEEEGGPGKGEAQRRLHWLQVVSVSVVCLSFRRRYFYNKIRNYEALVPPPRKHNTSTAWGDAGLSRTGAVDAGGGPFFELRSRPSSPYHPATHLRLNSHPIAGA